MARFIHLTDERLMGRIEKSGISMTRLGSQKKCVFAVPVLPDFQISHQWVREMKRTGIRTIGAIQFMIPDTDEVLVGRYNEEPISVTASVAVKIFLEHDSGLGWEVRIPRRILPKEIEKCYTPNQMVGWRFYPGSNGNPPSCGCEYCQRGLIKNRKLREEYMSRTK
jgi:hypothetical protein